VSSGLVFRRSLYESRSEWHRERVNALRQLRRDAGLSQQEFAELIAAPLNTFRMWDSGLRAIPCGYRRGRYSVDQFAAQHDETRLRSWRTTTRNHVRGSRSNHRPYRLTSRRIVPVDCEVSDENSASRRHSSQRRLAPGKAVIYRWES